MTNERSVEFKAIYGSLDSWENLCEEARAFATEVGPDRLISISQAAGPITMTMTVWYWSS